MSKRPIRSKSDEPPIEALDEELPRRRNPLSIFDWYSGPLAQMEIVGLDREAEAPLKVNCTLPWRSAIRQPMRNITITLPEFEKISKQLAKVKQCLNDGYILRGGKGKSRPKPKQLSDTHVLSMVALQSLGTSLFLKLLPEEMRDPLEQTELYFEIGVDERLNDYPLELMFDGTDYCCLKHRIGRYVVSAKDTAKEREAADLALLRSMDLSVLLVAVADPIRDGFVKLDRVEKEAVAIKRLLIPLVGKDNITFLRGDEATSERVTGELARQDRKYHILHFCGHAHFDSKNPAASELLLHNSSLSTGDVKTFVGRSQPLVCFINACQSANAADATDRFNLYGLGKAFLESGAYLLGSRSEISDAAAEAFALAFYTALLSEGEPLGEAVRRARLACKNAEPNSLDWASYILYGDPRFGFTRRPSPC